MTPLLVGGRQTEVRITGQLTHGSRNGRHDAVGEPVAQLIGEPSGIGVEAVPVRDLDTVDPTGLGQAPVQALPLSDGPWHRGVCANDGRSSHDTSSFSLASRGDDSVRVPGNSKLFIDVIHPVSGTHVVGAQQLLHPEREIDGDKNDDHRGEYEGQDEQGPSEAPAGGQHTANTGSWITCQAMPRTGAIAPPRAPTL